MRRAARLMESLVELEREVAAMQMSGGTVAAINQGERRAPWRPHRSPSVRPEAAPVARHGRTFDQFGRDVPEHDATVFAIFRRS